MADTGQDPLVTVRNLRKVYGSTVAVDAVTFDIHADEIFALLGPNGAGKTTIVELLQGLRTPTDGEVRVFGLDVQADRYEIKERIGVVPQSFHTFERLTVRENVALVGALHSDPLDVDSVIEDLGLGEYADQPFHSLSGGYRRRTGIAMALVSDPELLFLDEPTAGLDPAARRSTWEQIERLPEMGTAVVLTTHYMDEVEQLADRVALLVDGHVEVIDTVPALVDTYAGSVKVLVEPDDAGGIDELEALLEDAAPTVYWNRQGTLVGVFDDRTRAQDVFSELHEVDPGRSIELVTAGMADVFLELAGGTLDPTGDLQ